MTGGQMEYWKEIFASIGRDLTIEECRELYHNGSYHALSKKILETKLDQKYHDLKKESQSSNKLDQDLFKKESQSKVEKNKEEPKEEEIDLHCSSVSVSPLQQPSTTGLHKSVNPVQDTSEGKLTVGDMIAHPSGVQDASNLTDRLDPSSVSEQLPSTTVPPICLHEGAESAEVA